MPKIDLARVRRRQMELVARAKATIPRNPDGGWLEEDLLAKLVEIMPFDVDGARRKEAQRLIDAVTRPGFSEPDGQIVLPGFEAFNYEPTRLVRDSSGNIYEGDVAPLSAMIAESTRARDNANRALHWSNIKSVESEHFAQWVVEQLTKGRPASELTWGNCIRETGLWRPAEKAA